LAGEEKAAIEVVVVALVLGDHEGLAQAAVGQVRKIVREALNHLALIKEMRTTKLVRHAVGSYIQ
jgi:hypothetical protein